MPVPSTISDLDAVANNNSPAGSESAKGTVDDYLRAHAAFIKQNYDDIQDKAPIANPAFTGTPTGITAAHVGAVALTGNETVAGVKTFSSSPVVPAPTTDMQAATKAYVDGQTVASASETVAGIIELATQAEVTAMTDAERAVTPATLGGLMTMVGVGQTWQNVASSRAVNTSYRNTSGKPIQVSFAGSANNDGTFQVSTNNSTWVTIATHQDWDRAICNAIIPNDHYYKTTCSAIRFWLELR